MAAPAAQIRSRMALSEPETCSDIADEAVRLLGIATAAEVPLRLIGGLAIQLRAEGTPDALLRTCKDIDIITRRAHARAVGNLLAASGYEANRTFNTMNNGRRGLFYDPARERQLDLFVETFEMCHTIPVADRIEVDGHTLPLAELLLTKLQIVKLNEKDRRDMLAMLIAHEISDRDGDHINAARIAQLCALDWGLWRTCRGSLESCRTALGDYSLEPDERARAEARLTALWERIEQEPKSRRWKLRARVGDRVVWYVDPEEIGS